MSGPNGDTLVSIGLICSFFENGESGHFDEWRPESYGGPREANLWCDI